MTDYRAVDYEDFKRAQLLEEEAEALLCSVVPRSARRYKKDTTGPRREQLRAHVLLPPPEEEEARKVHLQARALLAAADDIYWKVIDRHGGQITKQAFQCRRLAPILYNDIDSLKSILRDGWFRGALRFDPDQGVKFPTFAVYWGRSAIQRANDRQTTISVSGSREIRKTNKGWGYHEGVFGVEWEHQFGGSEASNPEARIIRQEQSEKLHKAIQSLPEKQRKVMTVLANGGSIADAGRKLGFSRERARQITNQASATIRELIA